MIFLFFAIFSYFFAIFAKSMVMMLNIEIHKKHILINEKFFLNFIALINVFFYTKFSVFQIRIQYASKYIKINRSGQKYRQLFYFVSMKLSNDHPIPIMASDYSPSLNVNGKCKYIKL